MELVLDIGNYQVKGALFEDGKLIEPFTIPFEPDRLKNGLKGKSVDFALVASVNPSKEADFLSALEELSIPHQSLKIQDLTVKLEVDEPDAVGQDRIANVYGALSHFPQNECIVVDMGTAVTFDCVGMGGSYLGGAIYPGLHLGARALDAYTELLPLVDIEIPSGAIAKTTQTHIQSGLYWGLLGAIERITDEMRRERDNPSDVKVIATGGSLAQLGEPLAEDLRDLVDLIDPHLTLLGLHEILKEINHHE